MSNEPRRLLGSENDPLGDLLRGGALDERPAFSEDLHSRIMLAIRRTEPVSMASLATCVAVAPAIAREAAQPRLATGTKREVSRQRGGVFAWVSLAAGLLVMAAVGWRLSTVAPHSGTTTSNQVASVTTGMPAQVSSDGTYTWADLDHDARLTAQLVVDQMPFEAPYEDLNFGPSQQ